ncbi:putative restriction endonuclease [Lachnospiraceae bacterium]|nr:putative restriction endonuclease [Lachnospiraceae bacterium]
MKIYVGVTDSEWYEYNRIKNLVEVNFWRPGGQVFKALDRNDLFLFKLHYPENYIVGGGYFVSYSYLPTYLAWDAFGDGNGTSSLNELNRKISKYRQKNNMVDSNPYIGCIILTDVFYFDRNKWIPAPDDFGKYTVQGKSYSDDTTVGKALFDQVRERLFDNVKTIDKPQFGYSQVKHRIGQGAFRIIVTDNYQRRCAITGEKTLPVLQAAHIKPVSQEGPYIASNGLLLKSDFHTLFDDGYITIDSDYRVDVSKRLHDDYGNGKDYYKYHGQKLMIIPEKIENRPSKEFLQWHNENIFLG